MYARTALLAALLAAAPIVQAAEESVADLASQTGLTERNVRMVLGARTQFAEYRVTYRRVDRQFREAVGDVRYEQLTGRKPLPAKAETERDVRVATR